MVQNPMSSGGSLGVGASMPGKIIHGGVHRVDMHARKSADGRAMLAPRRIFALKKRGKRVEDRPKVYNKPQLSLCKPVKKRLMLP